MQTRLGVIQKRKKGVRVIGGTSYDVLLGYLLQKNPFRFGEKNPFIME